MPRLIVLEDTGTARQINLRLFPFVIGRAPGCDLVFDSPQVSRTHAALEGSVDAVEIRDLESNNGIHVNGKRVQRCLLSDGDEISLGGRQMRFLARRDVLSDADALRLVTMSDGLTELDLRKLAPPARD